MRNIETIFVRVLENFVRLSHEVFGNGWPMTAVVGGGGLNRPRAWRRTTMKGIFIGGSFDLRLKCRTVRRRNRTRSSMLCSTRSLILRASGVRVNRPFQLAHDLAIRLKSRAIVLSRHRPLNPIFRPWPKRCVLVQEGRKYLIFQGGLTDSLSATPLIHTSLRGLRVEGH